MNKFISDEIYELKIKANKTAYELIDNVIKEFYELNSADITNYKIFINDNGNFTDKNGIIYKISAPNDPYEISNVSEYSKIEELFYFTLGEKYTALHFKWSFIYQELSRNGLLIRFIPKEDQDDYMKITAVNQNKEAIQYV
jgi:hypothetical protein